MKKQKRLLSFAGVVAAGLLVTACGTSGGGGGTSSNSSSNSSGGNSTASSSGGGNSPYEIGMLSALTGSGAASGKLKVDGAQLAINEINAKGGVNGHPLKLIVEDDQTTNPGTVNAFNKLVSQYPKLTAIIGPIRSTEVQAINPNIQQAGVPVLIGGTDPQLTHENDPWIFRFRPNDSYSARTMAYYLIKKLGLKKIAIVHSTDAFGTGGETYLKKYIAQYGGTVVSDQGYTNHATDYTSIITALKSANPQAVATYFTYGADLGIFLKQYSQFGMKATIMGSSSISSSDVIHLLGNQLNGDYGTVDYAYGQNQASVTFGKALEKAYPGVIPDNYSSYTYDAVNVLASVLAKSGTSHKAVQQGLFGVKGFKGAEGTYNFDKNGDGLHGYTVVKFQGSKPVILKSYNFYQSSSSGN
ncbi:ABC transporter substrate-binding protein [Alicyclobacillus tolerans]|uniref:ABC transporter substrate-binding protein n=1 Tax=Alicyclobacillus tolerans TaxID=90970 RepID=UPI001F35F730|nr:ABC transporter substrate-binding protein [Alicyclobacillus tolerans]MCF8565584.1 ABC transporter substrate-binding protein [Alicyclobacillus tolerans]